MSGRTLDFRRGGWGRNVEMMRRLDDNGHRWKVAIFSRQRPQCGDYLLLSQRDGTDTRYQITDEPKWCGDPHDMYFATIRFAPRPAPSNPSPVDQP